MLPEGSGGARNGSAAKAAAGARMGRRHTAASRAAPANRHRPWRLMFTLLCCGALGSRVRLDVAVGEGSLLVVGEALRTQEVDAQGVPARAGVRHVAGPHAEPVAVLVVDPGVAAERGTASREGEGVDAVLAAGLQGRAVVLVLEGAVQGGLLRNETEVHGGPQAAASRDLRRGFRRGAPGAGSGGDDAGRRFELAGEVRADQAPRRGVVGPVVGTERVDLVIVGEGDVRAVLRVEGDLEVVGQVPVGPPAEAPRA